jgi:hypothetical protein
MTRRVDFQLTEEQLKELEQAINSSEHPEVRQRAIAIRLLGLGHHPEKVAEMVMVKANTCGGYFAGPPLIQATMPHAGSRDANRLTRE